MHDVVFMHGLAAVAAGLFAGALSGLLGVTPGGILVPSLALVVGRDQHQAQAISLIAQLVPTSMAGLHIYRRAGHSAGRRPWLLVAVGFLPGAYLGARAAILLADQTLRWAFIAYLVVLGLSVAAKGRSEHRGRPERSAAAPPGTAALLLVGAVAGASSGLLGIGGGLAIIALLTLLLAVPQHEAQAISLAVSALPLSLPAVFVYATGHGSVPVGVTALVVVGLVVGTLLGAKVATRLDAHALRRWFLVLICTMAGLMAYQALALPP